ncbi:MAG: right-handed parallel beta-helix repeat-containing protein [Rubripirellula sp.]
MKLRRHNANCSRKHHPRRLRLESLERRRVLASFAVTTPLDVVDTDDSLISLREAITMANDTVGVDQISFDAAVFAAPTTIELSLGQLTITDGVEIQGPGQDTLTIDGMSATRIFEIATAPSEDRAVTISDLTMTAGRTIGFNEGGGAIRQFSATTLTLDSVAITNSQTFGGNAGGGAIASAGTLVVENSLIAGNATASDNSPGGAIAGTSTVTIRNSHLMGNFTEGVGSRGGAVSSTASLTIENSSLSHNSTAGQDANGGAVGANSRISIQSSSFTANETRAADADGGAIAVFQASEAFGGSLTVTDTEIDSNQTLNTGARGGGIYGDASDITVANSSITRNETTGDGSNGGGIWLTRSDLTISQSTVSGNSALATGSIGGGIGIVGGSMTANGVTVSDNEAEGEAGGIQFDADLDTASLTLINSIVAGNRVTAAAGTAPDLHFFQTTPTLSVQSSLIGNNGGTPLVAAAVADSEGNLIGGSTPTTELDAGLDALTVVGQTRIHPLSTGSIAIDAGDAGLSTDVVSDQRGDGFSRVAGAAQDMGAMETQVPAAADFVVTTLTDEIDFDNETTSLREAIIIANGTPGTDAISFDEVLRETDGTIAFAHGSLRITDSVSISGLGRQALSIDATGLSRAIEIGGDADVTIEDLTITGGRSAGSNPTLPNFSDAATTLQNGGGLRSDTSGVVTLRSVSIIDNQTLGNHSIGGGIWATSGTLVIEDSLIDNNRGAGIAVVNQSLSMIGSSVVRNLGSGIVVDASGASIVNSTLSTNTGTTGGGLQVVGDSTIALVQSTIFGNTAEIGGGVSLADEVTQPVTIDNTIIAGNTGTVSHPDLSLPFISTNVDIAFSLVGDSSDTVLTESQTADENGNLIGHDAANGGSDVIDALLGPLVASGVDAALVHLPSASSPAIDAGDDARAIDSSGADLISDARGLPFQRISGTVDMGAVESQIATPIIVWNDPADIPVGTALGQNQLNATTQSPGTFAYTPVEGTVLDLGDDQVLTAVFTPDDLTVYQETTVTVSLDVVDLLDRGDAPDSYGTLIASNGAAHHASPLSLGELFDGDVDGQPTPAADGDGADDDGVVFMTPIFTGANATTASLLVTVSANSKLDAWIDFDADGTFDDTTESLFGASSLSLVTGVNVVPFSVPSGATAGDTFVRFRISTNGGLMPNGIAADGEVEDYAVTILADSVPTDAVVSVTGSQITLVRDGDDLVVNRRTVEVFRVANSAIDQLTIFGDEFSNVLTVDQTSGDALPSGGLIFEGGDRVNTLRWVGGTGTLDLTPTGNLTLRQVDAIDLTDTDAQSVLVDSAAAREMDPDGGGVIITGHAPVDGQPNDQIMFADGPLWRMGTPEVVFGTAFRKISLSDTFIQTDFGSGWHNIASPSDVNNNGSITANDALVIINELGRRTYSDRIGSALVDPATVDPWPGFYYDQNGDGLATALDALRVINQLARLTTPAGGSGEAESATIIGESTKDKTNATLDRLIANDEFVSSLF